LPAATSLIPSRSPHEKAAWEGLWLLTEWFLLTVTHQGPHAAGLAIKDWATQAQSTAVGDSRPLEAKGQVPLFSTFLRGSLQSGWNQKAAWTFSSIGRSIPPSTRPGDDVELIEWARRLWSEDAPPDHATLDDIYEFTKSTMSTLYQKEMRRPEVDPLFGDLKLNISASLERSKAKGGVYAYYRERAMAETIQHTARTPEGNYPYIDRSVISKNERVAQSSAPISHLSLDEFMRVSQSKAALYQKTQVPPQGSSIKAVPDELSAGLKAIAIERVAQAIAEDDIEEFIRSGQVPHMRPLVLRERGQKKRLATISSASLVVAGQRINRALLRLLKHSKTASYSLRGETETPACIAAGAQGYSTHENFEFLSTDLSAASDYLHHSVNQAVWAGIWEVIGHEFPCSYQWVGQKLTGPMLLDPGTPDLPEELKAHLGKASTRGALMGLPLAWPILTLVNEWAASRAAPRGGQPVFETCGDDMAAAWTTTMTETYFQNLKRAGLVVNQKKTFRSKTGLIFVEKLFKLSPKIKVEKFTALPTAPAAQCKTQSCAVWVSEDKLYHRLVSRIPRPTLSALSQARRHGQPGDDTIPSWATLAQTISEELKECTPAQRKQIIPLCQDLHPEAFRIWNQSGLPLHWPRFLGGWGLPGRQEAPPLFRKAAAVLITQNDPELLLSIRRVFSLGRLTGIARTVVQNINTRIDNAPTTDDPTMPMRGEVEEEATARVTTYFSLLQDKARKGPALKLSSIISQIKHLVRKSAEQWGTARPMGAEKAVSKGKELILTRLQQRIDLDIETALEYNEVFDVTLKQDRLHLQPEQRTRLFVRGQRNRPSPATADVVGSLAATLAQAKLLDAKDTMELRPDTGATTTSGEGPSYTFRDRHAEWESMRRCRTLMQTASSPSDLDEKLANLSFTGTKTICRDEAGRFVSRCTPEKLKAEDQRKLATRNDLDV
jgi:hypothetical protein